MNTITEQRLVDTPHRTARLGVRFDFCEESKIVKLRVLEDQSGWLWEGEFAMGSGPKFDAFCAALLGRGAANNLQVEWNFPSGMLAGSQEGNGWVDVSGYDRVYLRPVPEKVATDNAGASVVPRVPSSFASLLAEVRGRIERIKSKTEQETAEVARLEAELEERKRDVSLVKRKHEDKKSLMVTRVVALLNAEKERNRIKRAVELGENEDTFAKIR